MAHLVLEYSNHNNGWLGGKSHTQEAARKKGKG
jgi:hypothetical protein